MPAALSAKEEWINCRTEQAFTRMQIDSEEQSAGLPPAGGTQGPARANTELFENHNR